MSLEKVGITLKEVGGMPFASIRANVKDRDQVGALIEELRQSILEGNIAGPAWMIRYFVHSYAEGFDAEIGFPVIQPVETARITTRMLPTLEVLAKVSPGVGAPLGETYQALFSLQQSHGLISDEYLIEIFIDNDDPQGNQIEVCLVRHQWEQLFRESLTREMGTVVGEAVLPGDNLIFVDSLIDERFKWAKAAVDRLDKVSDDYQRYEVLSACSHIFPPAQAEKLRIVYQQEFAHTGNMQLAVDQVIQFMSDDPGWPSGNTYREGNIIYTTKRPSDPEGYARATTNLERKQAYCFCPIISAHLEDGMSPTFCYCSAGWERKQWETALNERVRVDIVKSLLKGNEVCTFAVHLPNQS